MTIDDKTFSCGTGDAFFIPAKVTHILKTSLTILQLGRFSSEEISRKGAKSAKKNFILTLRGLRIFTAKDAQAAKVFTIPFKNSAFQSKHSFLDEKG